MREDLRPRAEPEGVGADHPGFVSRDISPQDRCNTEAERQRHRRTRQQSNDVKEWAIETRG